MNGYGHYYPFRNTVYTFDGGSQRIYWYHQTYRIDNYPNSQVTCPNLSTQGSFATGNPYDPFASNSTYGGKGYYIIQTPYEANTQIPYHINIWQVPPAVDTGGTRTRFYRNSGGSYNYYQGGSYGSENNSYANWITSLGNGWEYTYETNYQDANASFVTVL